LGIESVRRPVRAEAEPARTLVPVSTPAHALELLASIWLGRIAYEADDVDLATGTGWSVIVTGRAGLVTGADLLRRCRAILRSPVGSAMDLAVRIQPSIVTGYVLDGPPHFHPDRKTH
jgi:hypothetical protein